MGVEPCLVASSLEGVLAQRLVRVLCPHCKEEDHTDTTRLSKINWNRSEAPKSFARLAVASVARPVIMADMPF